MKPNPSLFAAYKRWRMRRRYERDMGALDDLAETVQMGDQLPITWTDQRRKQPPPRRPDPALRNLVGKGGPDHVPLPRWLRH